LERLFAFEAVKVVVLSVEVDWPQGKDISLKSIQETSQVTVHYPRPMVARGNFYF
jgi:hypothetical protein